jgi:hypothetical protein
VNFFEDSPVFCVARTSGYDPYNSLDADNAILIEAMERAWRACCVKQDDLPSCLLIPQWVADYARLLVETPAVHIGHEFYPYG